MEHEDLVVKSFFLESSHEVCFYITNFDSITGYMYLASNFNKYYFIITNETEATILAIEENLLTRQTSPQFHKENIVFICSTDEHVSWCQRHGFSTETTVPVHHRNHSTYSPSIVKEKSDWAYKGTTRLFPYYMEDSLRILHLEGLEHHWDILPLLNNETYCLVSWPCYFHKLLYEHTVNALHTKNPYYDRKNVVFLAPNLDAILFSYEYGFHSILANQNCLIDYDLFTNKNNIEIKYDMVMNCRPEKWKRPFLAEKVDNLAYIKGYSYGAEVYDYSKLRYKYTNDRRLDASEVIQVYNESFCGGIFSENEGACYVSSEYLLCGLPVISTDSRGGRNVWYTGENSIIVDADKNAVAQAVQTCIENIHSGKMNRHQIRLKHIETSNEMRDRIIQTCQYIFDTRKVYRNAREYWNKTYFHTLLKTVPLQDTEELLRT